MLVVDRSGTTAPGLTREEFGVYVNGREVELVAADGFCDDAPVPDPGTGDDLRRIVPGPASTTPGATPPLFVLAFDYFHLESADRAITASLEALRRHSLGNERHMVVSIGGNLRIEQPLTRSIEEVSATLDRMREDRDLYAGTHGGLTRHRFFARVESLIELLALYPGKKSIVLFSGPTDADGFHHDPQYKRIGALASRTRTAIYPVDSAGLRTPLDPGHTSMHGPPELRRLANVTGGRMTSNTNDVSLAYGKAVRDASCQYTLAFRDEKPREGIKRRVSVELPDHPKLRAIHADGYLVRSEEDRRTDLFFAAELAPDLFPPDELKAELETIAPGRLGRWVTELTIELPGKVVEAGSWRLVAHVRKPNGTSIRSFTRRGEADELEGGTLLETLKLRPGSYELSVILSAGDRIAPRALVVPVTLGELPG